jgi:TolB protein
MRRLVRLAATAGAVAAALLAGAAGRAEAQDTARVIGRYQPGTRPGIVVLPAAGLDTVRAMVQRDLDFSDRFEAVTVADRPSTNTLNYGLYRSLGATFALELVPGAGGVTARLHDIARGQVRSQATVALPAPSATDAYRLAIHKLSDEVVRWATGRPGYAASRLLYLGGDGRVYRIDSDGFGNAAVTGSGRAFSPAWAPDGQRFAYTRMDGGRGSIVVQSFGGGTQTVPGTTTGMNYTAAFAPDGRTVAYTHMTEDGAEIYSGNVADQCCAQRLTASRFADNLSPTYSPDGRRIAFISSRAGGPQLYVMSADGTDQDVLAPFDFGDTGPSNAPEWSPDGANVVFHREVSRSPQIFVVDVARQRVKQVTTGGRNTDPTWAPDGRHAAFVSDRSGRLQLWVIDLESGRVRQLPTPGAVRLPAWSRLLGGN